MHAHVLGSVHPCKHPWKTFRDVSKIARGDIRKKKRQRKNRKKNEKQKLKWRESFLGENPRCWIP